MKREFKSLDKASESQDYKQQQHYKDSDYQTKEIEIKIANNPESKKRNLRESINDIIEQDNQTECHLKRRKIENQPNNGPITTLSNTNMQPNTNFESR